MIFHGQHGVRVRAGACDRVAFRMSPVRRTLESEADFSLI